MKLQATEEPTTVIFRVYKKSASGNVEVVAVFPYTTEGYGNVRTYEHIGQHGSGDVRAMIGITRLAKPEEYLSLLKELNGLGYVVKVRQRVNYDLVYKSYREQETLNGAPIKVSLRADVAEDFYHTYTNAFTGTIVSVDTVIDCDAYELSEEHSGDYIVFTSESLAVIIPSIDLEFI